jgi:hypothetical protein
MVADWLGWSGLTPNEQLAGTIGGVVGLWSWPALKVAWKTFFGGLGLRRARRKRGQAIDQRVRKPASASPQVRARARKPTARPKRKQRARRR